MPQVYLESLIPEHANSNQRLDFIIDSEEGLKIVEIDGKQHESEAQSHADKTRDGILADSGFDVIRIPTEDVLAIDFDKFKLAKKLHQQSQNT